MYSVSQTTEVIRILFIFFTNGYEFLVDFYPPIMRSYIR